MPFLRKDNCSSLLGEIYNRDFESSIVLMVFERERKRGGDRNCSNTKKIVGSGSDIRLYTLSQFVGKA